MTDDLRLVFPGTTVAVRTALLKMVGNLQQLDLDAEKIGSIELVVAEALNNIVEHAFAEQNGRIDLRLTNGERGLYCAIEDDGSPMPDGRPPIGNPPDLSVDLQDLPEGGFGWFLIREITRDLGYERVENHNRLTFRIPVGDDFTRS
ncbi:ATP-binding protein [Candidatus Halocynthiibacter alkanivorans]|jgi:serine/threonine-protein kinase RsbW|uniref:ATP-binding protein n=1 Tax=Candidatus Halocynthiibacter alkanivorans TaxID=2267619 RepID=UPI000DF312EF|nr:ATP-binding protein [Candidatus Halocynthiibacter alkanivorans]